MVNLYNGLRARVAMRWDVDLGFRLEITGRDLHDMIRTLPYLAL